MIESTPTLAFIGPLGWPEMVILAVLGVLIFGKRLPEVGKSIGKGIVEFKKGLSGVQEEIENQASKSSESSGELEDMENQGSTFEGSQQEEAEAGAQHRSSSA
jgi:sec-independent protein translocase protein TatA